jgi:olefin beta-lactone synthetase
MSQQNSIQLLLDAAAKYPQKIAIIDANESVTFEQLLQMVKQKANYFTEKKISAGDRVLVFTPMSIHLYVNVLGLFYIGATAVFLDEWVSKKRLELCCTLADCKGIIAGWKVRLLAMFSKSLRCIPVQLNPTALSTKTEIQVYQSLANDTALITFTTGSTGIPKAANRTHAFLQAQFTALMPLLHQQQDMIDMPMLPIVLLLNLGIGRTSVIADFKASKPNSFDAKKIAQQIAQQQVQSITASPHYLLQLAQHYQVHQIVSPIQKVLIGGAPVFPNDAQILVKHLCANTTIVYGSTEAEPIAHTAANQLITDYSNTNQGLYVGQIDASATVQIIHYTPNAIGTQQLDKMILEQGRKGEIIVSGAHVLDAYFKNNEAFVQNKIIDKHGKLWHRTGDLGYFDELQQLFLLGRCKQSFIHEKQVIYPFIIEQQLQSIDGVQKGTILQDGQDVIVFVETKKYSKQLEEIVKTKLQELNLQYYTIRFQQIPRDPRHHSKIDYDKLAAEI